MSGELKEDGAWVPLTPPKSAPARYDDNSTSSKGVNHVNFDREFGASDGACPGGDRAVVRNCDGSVSKIGEIDGAKRAEGCGEIARKVGFVVDGKPEGIIGGISENVSTKDSSVLKNQTSKKRSRKAVDLNKKPQKRMRMKRHRPKVFDETKPLKPSTPKPRTPKRPKKKKKEIPETVVNPSKGVDGKAVAEFRNNSCRRKLDFEVQNCVVDQNIPKICDAIQIEPLVEPKRQSSSRYGSSWIVYRRVFKPNECLKNSRKTGPNCPKVYKKKRTVRKRVTVFDKYNGTVPTVSPPKKRRRTAVNEPLDLYPVAKDIKRRPRSLRQKQKSSNAWISMGKVSQEMGPTLNLTWKANFKKKRSKTSTYFSDLSLFVSDISKLQLSEAFLLKASSIRTRETGVDKFTACVENQDEVVQHFVTKSSTEQDEFPKDSVLSCNKSSTEQEELPQGYVLSCNESIEKCLAEDEVMLGVETDLPVNGESSEVKCTKETGSFSDIATPDLVGSCDEEENVSENEDHDALIEALVDYSTQRMECLNINDRNNELVLRDQNVNGAIVPSEGKFDPIKKRKQWPKVDLDPETMRVGTLLMEKGEGEDTEKEDDDRAKYWKEQIELFRGRVDSFIARMHQVQGDKTFSPWKGSVVDSVVGVFLTQNVSDHLSSSAFMSLVARFPPAPDTQHNDCDGTCDCVHAIEQVKISEPPCDKPEELSMTENCSLLGPTNHVPPSEKSKELSIKENFPSSDPANQVPSSSDESEHLSMIENYVSLGPTNQVLLSDKSEESSENCPSSSPTSQVEVDPEDGIRTSSQTESTPGKRKGKVKEKQETPINWDGLRKQTLDGISRRRTNNNVDSVNWEAIRQAPVEELAETIIDRGMNNLLAARIKDFLDRIFQDHGSIDLEWLRDVPPDKAKDYLLSITGLGLKSVECVRLLSLHHCAFPVDTNVGRILVRLGWVPLQPLPEDLQIHHLNQYPMLDTIQKYIWPRVCDYDQQYLYEWHYHLIVFGKAICTKRQPNCNACPMRGDCRHFASEFASSKLRVEGARGENVVGESSVASSAQDLTMNTRPPMLSYSDGDISVVENNFLDCEPIVEFPASPEPSSRMEILERDIEDLFNYEPEIPTIELNGEEFIRNVMSFIGKESEMSRALVTVRPEFASIPTPKLMDVKRLRTVHHVYELPDTHPLLSGFNKPETGDPCPYLFAIWTADETLNSSQEPGEASNHEQSITRECCSGESSQQNQNDLFVHGTILIPCRTANRGSFPLNGTYFQVNEVFADHKSSRHPIAVERKLIWNLRRRSLYCGTSVTSICRGMSLDETQYVFWRGFICIRGFDSKSRGPKPLARRFHNCRTRQTDDE